MADQEITTIKFNACITKSISAFEVYELNDQRRKKELCEYNFSEFNKIMIKHDLEEYSKLLFNYFIDILETNKLNSDSYNSYILQNKENDEFRLELLETINFLFFKKEKLITTSVIINKHPNQHPIKNEQLIFYIETNLQQLFKKYFKKMQINGSKDEDLSQENIERLIGVFRNRLSKKEGASPKNQHLTILISEISDLIRVDRFLKNIEITDIDQIEVTGKDRLFIYNSLDFWGFIPEREKDNTSTPQKYLNSTIKQAKKFFPPDYNLKRKERLAKLKIISKLS